MSSLRMRHTRTRPCATVWALAGSSRKRHISMSMRALLHISMSMRALLHISMSMRALLTTHCNFLSRAFIAEASTNARSHVRYDSPAFIHVSL